MMAHYITQDVICLMSAESIEVEIANSFMNKLLWHIGQAKIQIWSIKLNSSMMALVNSFTELFELRGWLYTVYCNLAKPLLLLCNHYSAVLQTFKCNFCVNIWKPFLRIGIPVSQSVMGPLSSMDWCSAFHIFKWRWKKGSINDLFVCTELHPPTQLPLQLIRIKATPTLESRVMCRKCKCTT